MQISAANIYDQQNLPEAWDFEQDECGKFHWVQTESKTSLKADKHLATAVVICLFTNKRAYDDDVLPYSHEDRQGWWADSIDVKREEYERELGSRLWLIQRTKFDDNLRLFVEEEAKAALSVLIEQGAVAKIEVKAVSRYSDYRIDLYIECYSQDGVLIYDQKFQIYWEGML